MTRSFNTISMKEQPPVTIMTPVYNGEAFLAECIESVCAQSYQNWTYLIGNNCSTDGTLALAQKYAKLDPRIKISNNDKFLSLSDNWNNCFRQTRGKYVSGLGADDVMPANFLETLVNAMEAHPECGLAHCPLRLIDENGNERTNNWQTASIFARSSDGLVNQRHLRRAPFDGLLYLCGESVYVTLTQLLVRRTVFDDVGFYNNRWGGVGDFHWSMRVALATDTIHVPNTWGGWRIHSRQAGADNTKDPRDYNRKITEMIEDAMHVSQPVLKDKLPLASLKKWCSIAADLRNVCWEVERLSNAGARRAFLIREILGGSKAARDHVFARLGGKSLTLGQKIPELVTQWFHEAQLGPAIVPC